MATATKVIDEKISEILHLMRISETKEYDQNIISLPHFGVTRSEVAEGVRLIHADAKRFPAILSLWLKPADILEIANVTSLDQYERPALILLQETDMKDLEEEGLEFDKIMFDLSDEHKGMRYHLFDYKGDGHLHDLLHDLVPTFGECVKMGLD